MSAVDGVNHCDFCDKKVYDFSNSKESEFLAILAENDNSICGRFRLDQTINTKNTKPDSKRWFSAAMVLLGINFFNQKTEAQASKPTVVQSTKIDESSLVVGEPMAGTKFDKAAELLYPENTFRNFVKSKIIFRKGMVNGRVFVKFNVNTDGHLSNFRILKSLSPLNDAEAIRVLKLSPKWNPGTLDGKPVCTDYVIPVIFQH